jgi:hypothetical protein
LDKNRFKPVWLSFFGLAWFFLFGSGFFSGLARFFQFGSVSAWFGLVFFGLALVWFCFFGFRLIKPKPNRSVFSKF